MKQKMLNHETVFEQLCRNLFVEYASGIEANSAKEYDKQIKAVAEQAIKDGKVFYDTMEQAKKKHYVFPSTDNSLSEESSSSSQKK